MPARLSSMEISDDNSSTPRAAANGYAPAPALANDENATNRRKSVRVVKKPKLFVQEPVVKMGAKRKRAEAQAEDDASEKEDANEDEDEDEDEEEESEGEADVEELKEKRRKSAAKRKAKAPAKPAAKRVKKTRAAPAAVAKKTPGPKSVNGPAPKARRGRAKQAASGGSAEGLYTEVFLRGKTLDAVAAEWVSLYQRSAPEAMRDVVNFVLRSAGCELEVTVHDIEDQDNVTGRLSDLQDEYQAQNITDYPLVLKTKIGPPFRATLTGFIKSLILTAHASSVLYEDLALIENFQVWVTTMSSSAIRPFRHTATVVSLAAVSTLCEVASEIAESTAKSLRQLESEKKKARVNKGRIGALQEKVDDGSSKRETVEGVIKDIFDTVFVHRYRDVDPKIRADCVQALGHWIVTLPELFFEGQYLRYLGWVLSDTSPPTRSEVVKQLQKLFKNQNNVGGLRHFIERFRSRLVEMATRDADAGVRASTVELLDSIREAGMLEPDDVDTVGRLIFDSEARVRKAVVGFFAENINDLYDSKIEELGGEEAIEDVLVGDSDEDFENPRTAWVKLKCLVEVLSSYDSEDHEELPSQIERGPAGGSDVLVTAGVESRFSLAAQALYEKIPEIREWETLAGYLLFDHSSTTSRGNGSDDVEVALKTACKLDEKEEIILLEVLNAAVRLNLMRSDEQEAAKKGKRKKAPKRDSLEHQETAARHLAQLIPSLLNKFGAVPDAASAVLRLEHVLNLDVFQEPGQESGAYSSLLDNINRQFMTHGHQAVLVEASAALLHARSFEELGEVTEGKVQSLWEDTVATLHSLTQGKDIGTRGRLTVNVLTGLSNTVRRLGNLASISDCVEVFEKVPAPSGKRRSGTAASEEPLKVLLAILNRGEWIKEKEEIGELENELVLGAMKAVLFYFMWKKRTLQEKLIAGDEIADVDIDQLQDCREDFVSKLTLTIQTRLAADNLRLAAIGTLLDLYTLFATLHQASLIHKPDPEDPEAAETTQRIFTLIQEIPPDLQSLITASYTTVEKAYAKKSRRTLEQAEDDEPIDDEEDDQEDEDEGEAERQNQALLLEQSLCQLTGKIVLAIIARLIDTEGEGEGPGEGRMRERLMRNRGRLGANFKEVVGYLEEEKAKGKRGAASGKKKKGKEGKAVAVSEEVVVEDEEGDGDVEMGYADEEEELRIRELVVDDGEEEDGGGGGGGGGEEYGDDGDEDEVMGD
ncbi:hypothetical protein FGG08_007127 [Glutinoglossum americanum]|uniref:SCD domain-containing protein n=1 Tax=Glutinoglossum americanum TaxID=1670608 RepID=A0A9P8L0C5_9PEZI|nr:hypothetical protein FGG08_007127 [Glutinoglossum americanum]